MSRPFKPGTLVKTNHHKVATEAVTLSDGGRWWFAHRAGFCIVKGSGLIVDMFIERKVEDRGYAYVVLIGGELVYLYDNELTEV